MKEATTQKMVNGFWASLGSILAAPFAAGVEFIDTRPGGRAVKRHLGDQKFEIVQEAGDTAVQFKIDMVSKRAGTVRKEQPRKFSTAEEAALYALGAQDMLDMGSKLRRRTINAHERAVSTAVKAFKKATAKVEKPVAASPFDPLATVPAV